jgi:hypothetical protein
MTAISPEKRLKLLRRLDRFRFWRTTSQRRLCLGCGKLISGAQIKVTRSMGGLGLLRLRCPTEECKAGPMDWIEPDERRSG